MLFVEIADTPYKKAQGLMFRKDMPDDEGMLFVFDKPQKLRFWGVNTFIPLDIAFIDDNNSITQISHIKPMSDITVASSTSCSIAIEANMGFFDKNNINVGDKIELVKQEADGALINFIKDSEMYHIKIAQIMQDVQPQFLQTPSAIPVQTQNNKQNTTNLPTIDVSNLAGILEDSYDDTDNEQIPDEMQQPEAEPEITQESPELEEPTEFEVPEKEYPNFSSPHEAMQWAEQEHEVVEIWYKTKGGRDIKREVEPHGTFNAASTGNTIVVTFDETVGDIRAFIIDNILFNSFVGREFTPKFTVKT